MKITSHLVVRLSYLVVPAALLTASGLAQSEGNADQPAARTGWKKQEPLPTPWHFHDVDLISTTEGWSVSQPTTGDHGNIFHTVDAGKTWKQQGTLFRQLSGVSFADSLHGVAVGNEFRYTSDGGNTWLLSTSFGGTMYDVDLVDQNTGYACGFGEVKKTTDGGLTWVSQPVPIFGNLVGIDFVNVTTGWVVGSSSVFKT
ncbi:MAG: hypothetical protein ABIU29_02520, partial [Chthoniobacterales bacterium]